MKKSSWAYKIAQAEKTGQFTEQDIKEASTWVCCAVGEVRSTRGEYLKKSKGKGLRRVTDYDIQTHKDHKLPAWYETLSFAANDSSERPHRLTDLGMQFYNAVEVHDVDKAKHVYDLIQEEAKRLDVERLKGWRVRYEESNSGS